MSRTVRDIRTGRLDHWIILPEGVDHLMQVPDEMRKCVVFLYCREGGSPVPKGTAFFVSSPIPDYPDHSVGVLLTADHVIQGIRARSDDGEVLMRLNTKSGESIFTQTHADQWLQVGSGVDCALLPWRPGSELNVDWAYWPLGNAATDEVIEKEGIGLGDEVFMIGLFRNHLGRDRNEPIVRVGNIAAIPSDPIKTKLHGDIKAILVEARSIGGLSGSPVFVHMGYSRWRQNQVMTWSPEAGAIGPFLFLGLMHGHWDALETEIDLIGGEGTVNVGVGIVVPAEQILTGLRPIMEELGDMARKELDEKNTPTQDAVGDESEYERFDDLARKLVSTPKPEIDEKRKGKDH